MYLRKFLPITYERKTLRYVMLFLRNVP